MMSRQEMIDMYEDLEDDDLWNEVSKHTRAIEFYKDQLKKYLDRDPALQIVLPAQTFRYKIQYFTDLRDAARTLLLRRLPRLEDYPRGYEVSAGHSPKDA